MSRQAAENGWRSSMQVQPPRRAPDICCMRVCAACLAAGLLGDAVGVTRVMRCDPRAHRRWPKQTLSVTATRMTGELLTSWWTPPALGQQQQRTRGGPPRAGSNAVPWHAAMHAAAVLWRPGPSQNHTPERLTAAVPGLQ
jgi:hypothetical protein